MVYKLFDKKTSGGAIKSKIMSNQQLTEKLYKAIIRKFEKEKVYSSFKDNIWGADLADLLVNKYVNLIKDMCSKQKRFRFKCC